MIGRKTELNRLRRLAAESRDGRGNAIVVRGGPGIGKSALLDELAGAVTDVRVLRVTGLETEAELPFAALHLLLRPVSGLVGELPDPQRDALRAAFGQGGGVDADRFLVGLAVLTLLADLAEERPVLCLVDDAQWLDRASADALVFAARRLDADRITMVLAVRDDAENAALAGLTELRLDGLDEAQSHALLSQVADDLVAEVRERLVVEAQGNPLALIEFTRALSPEQRAGRLDPLPLAATATVGRLEESLRAAVRSLPQAARQLLVFAATEGTGNLGVVLRAAAGADVSDLVPAERARLVHVSEHRLEFRHPLVKAAAYREAPLAERIEAHRALAAVLDDEADADRRAWHLSAAALGPDEELGEVLRLAGQRARRRGSHASAVTAYERAAQLTVERERRAGRLTAAAESAVVAGQLRRARAVMERARRLTTDPAAVARLAVIQATVDSELGGVSAPARTLLDAVPAITADAPNQAANMLAQAANSAWFAGDHASLRASAELLTTLEPRLDAALVPIVRTVSGMERLVAGDVKTGLDLLRAALAPSVASARSVAHEEESVAATFAVFAALMSGNTDAACELASAWVTDCRRRGRIGSLPHALQLLTQAQLLSGRHLQAAAAGAEAWRIAEDTGQSGRLRYLGGILAWLSAIRGDDAECVTLAERAEGAVRERNGSGWGECALGLLDLVRGRPAALVERMGRIMDGPLRHTVIVTIAIPDFVEAAVRLGEPRLADGAFARFEAWAVASAQPWALAMVERCRALLEPDVEAEDRFRAALAHHVHGGRCFEHARTRLLYGEWLRRRRRRADAREQLSAAAHQLADLGAIPWAERARSELAATGGTLAPHQDSPLGTLTRRELDVVRLAATGATNRQIAAQLFLSPRTVGYHLYKAYPKLGVTTRAELAERDFG
ncbi:ATP-binding protein [Stackebrandtia nassauensis]|uniref:Transcriptional regulator, LuxR family n=1 Tax=Stackebrandtia nassauensis (strain DSM 44728 / CIP 108903 / NRRL B-16338 / NBRC 102104 / LLR-40K-21) TaxID=446470 RepID=D3PVG9_STANL|nr:LuxR family transcriptional regulator [Stackebrandtia nassauensis]ADD43083.1 transcriptional regulator, LuxR family [Stackebrandtia nassauensis DSM 44728]